MAFTNVWDADNPSDTTYVNKVDDYIRDLRTDVEERLTDMFYGFSGAESTKGVKNLNLFEQAANPTQATDTGNLFVKSDGTRTELYWLGETGDSATAKKITAAGKLNVAAGDYVADSIDQDDILLALNGYLKGKDTAETGEIDLIKSNGTVPCLKVGAVLSADTAPATDAAIANKKYVDTYAKFGTISLIATETATANAGQTLTDIDSTVATTDGLLLCVVGDCEADGKAAYGVGLSDSAGTPTTVLGCAAVAESSTARISVASYMIPVKRDEYYKCLWTGLSGNDKVAQRKYYWMPIGA